MAQDRSSISCSKLSTSCFVRSMRPMISATLSRFLRSAHSRLLDTCAVILNFELAAACHAGQQCGENGHMLCTGWQAGTQSSMYQLVGSPQFLAD